MKEKLILNILGVSLAIAMAFSIAGIAQAQAVGVSASANVSSPVARFAGGARASSTIRISASARAAMIASTTAARMAAMRTRDNTEIGNRVTTLNDLLSRIESMARLSDAEKSNFTSEIQSEISDLTSLQSNIGTDTSTTSLGSDSKSITQAYRIYALVVPQGSITAAADRINTIVTSFGTLETKLQTRITAAQTAGDDISAETSALADFTAKVSDAGTQAAAASSEVANLQPDNGVETVLASNDATLKDAHSKIQMATNDLKNAEEDATTIIKDIEALKLSSPATPSVTVTGTTSTETSTSSSQ